MADDRGVPTDRTPTRPGIQRNYRRSLLSFSPGSALKGRAGTLPFVKRRGLLLPRIEHGYPRLVEIAPVARDNRKPVMKGGRGKHEVRV